MKTESTVIETRTRPAEIGKGTVYTVAILAVLLIGYILMHAMRVYVQTPAINANRAAERSAGLAEVRAAAEKELRGDSVYINKNNGIVRLPIDRAMQLVIENGKDQAAFRSNLLARTEKAFKAPPAAPAAPPAFE
ncbi:MAG TPA: hypothetical protein VM680_07890 [Verrucomicrobiae bacterium]|nr:hypothetical protein [Verrucomicrobiae bacterium]